jgi:sugar lactone lactonase YvrE
MTRLVQAAVVSFVVFAVSLPAHAGPPIETLASFDPALGQIPESITTDRHGNLYFSWASTSTIQKRTPDGTISTFGTLPVPVFTLGVKVGPDGCVYTVSTSLSALAGAFVWRICTAGVVEQFATLDATGGPNDLAFDDDGHLYVTDPFLGRIWKLDRHGDARVWLDDPRLVGNAAAPALGFHAVGVDGIAFDEDKRNLYVDNLDYGTILRIEVRDGRPHDVSVFASDPLLRGADGIAFDDRGALVVAVNAQDSLVSIDPRGAITVIDVGGPLDGPSSVVFGATERDAHSLYVTSSAFSRAFGFEAGTPHPALLRLHAEHRGLPLP